MGEREAEILKALKAGESATSIASRLHIAKHRVAAIRDAHGIKPLMEQKNRTDKRIKGQSDLKASVPIEAVARKYGVAIETAKLWARMVDAKPSADPPEAKPAPAQTVGITLPKVRIQSLPIEKQIGRRTLSITKIAAMTRGKK